MKSLLESTYNTRFVVEGNYRYLRSDAVTTYNIRDINFLKEHEIKTIIDLRSIEEVKNKECILKNDDFFDYHHIQLDHGNIKIKNQEDVIKSYLTMINVSLEGIVNLILHSKTNVLFFCNAGKDRTGVVSAMILRRLGYFDEDIINNYLNSCDELEILLNNFIKLHPDVTLDLITPHKEYIKAFLEKIK